MKHRFCMIFPGMHESRGLALADNTEPAPDAAKLSRIR